MKPIILLLGMLMGLAGIRAGLAADASRKETPPREGLKVRKIGPQSYVGLTSGVETNRATVTVLSTGETSGTFRVTNREPHKILVWNVRVQTKSNDPGTDGLGWDTVADDYPDGSAHISPSGSGEFRFLRLFPGRWRICVLYSVDKKDEGQSFQGNYEAISAEQEESSTEASTANKEPAHRR